MGRKSWGVVYIWYVSAVCRAGEDEGANLIWGRVFKSVHLILDGVSNVFGLVQTAV